MSLAAGWSALKRPKYLSTDSHGIALTTRKGSKSLAWEEIAAARLYLSQLTLETKQGRVTASLSGYMPGVQKAIFATIARRADLYHTGPHRCARAEQAVDVPRTQPELPGAAGSPIDRTARCLFAGSLLILILIITFPLAGSVVILRLAHQIRAETWWLSAYRTRTALPSLQRMSKDVRFRENRSVSGGRHGVLAQRTQVRIFVAQAPSDPAALAAVPGFSVERQYAVWAPAIYQEAGSRVYEYDLFLWRRPRPVKNEVMVRLDYGRYHRWIAATQSSHSRDSGMNASNVPVYSNNWGDVPAREIQAGPFVGALPPLRSWDYGAWLPGTITSFGAWCTIRFSDGTTKRVHLDRKSAAARSAASRSVAAVPYGARIEWGLSPQEYQCLQSGRT